MPRETIDLPYQIDHLSILDEDGKLDEKLEPDLSDDFLLELHQAMLKSRRFDERLLSLQRQGKIGTFAPVKGQEASEIGAAAALDDKDWMVPSYREQAAQLWRGQSMESYMLVHAGYYQGHSIDAEKDIKNFPVAVPVGSQLLHAAGLGYAINLRARNNSNGKNKKSKGKSKDKNNSEIVMVFFGDGATSEGDFHEALNFAGVFQTPVVFLCQNNQWAISVPRERQSHSKTLAQKALAYGIPGIQVDGNDVLAVYAAAKEAADRARAGDGPTMIESVTYRLSVHTTADDPKRYREDKEVKKWEKRDPISRFQKYLKDKELLSDKDIESLEEEVKNEIKTAVDNAQEKMQEFDDDVLSMFEHIHAEMPPYLKKQQQELEKELEAQHG